MSKLTLNIFIEESDENADGIKWSTDLVWNNWPVEESQTTLTRGEA